LGSGLSRSFWKEEINKGEGSDAMCKKREGSTLSNLPLSYSYCGGGEVRWREGREYRWGESIRRVQSFVRKPKAAKGAEEERQSKNERGAIASERRGELHKSTQGVRRSGKKKKMQLQEKVAAKEKTSNQRGEKKFSNLKALSKKKREWKGNRYRWRGGDGAQEEICDG